MHCQHSVGCNGYNVADMDMHSMWMRTCNTITPRRRTVDPRVSLMHEAMSCTHSDPTAPCDVVLIYKHIDALYTTGKQNLTFTVH